MFPRTARAPRISPAAIREPATWRALHTDNPSAIPLRLRVRRFRPSREERCDVRKGGRSRRIYPFDNLREYISFYPPIFRLLTLRPFRKCPSLLSANRVAASPSIVRQVR